MQSRSAYRRQLLPAVGVAVSMAAEAESLIKRACVHGESDTFSILMVCMLSLQRDCADIRCVCGGGIVESAILSYYNRYMHMHMHIVTTYMLHAHAYAHVICMHMSMSMYV
jgi:hypothetical protein